MRSLLPTKREPKKTMVGLGLPKKTGCVLPVQNESGVMAMMMIAASGKETGSPSLYRRDADGAIHELYIL
jgi:ribosomal protein L30/L7E